jgi:hypothetical protein
VEFRKIDWHLDVCEMRCYARSEARGWGGLVLARGGGTQDVAEFFFQASSMSNSAAP